MSTAHIVVVLDADGTVVDLCRADEKGVKKSIETGELWILHPDTGKLIPREPRLALVDLRRGESWIEATAEGGGNAEEIKSKKNISNKPRSGLPGESIIEELAAIVRDRKESKPEGSYTSYLFNEGLAKILKKTGEEAIELVLAEKREDVVHEAADLIYHLLVLLEARDIPVDDLLSELERRRNG